MFGALLNLAFLSECSGWVAMCVFEGKEISKTNKQYKEKAGAAAHKQLSRFLPVVSRCVPSRWTGEENLPHQDFPGGFGRFSKTVGSLRKRQRNHTTSPHSADRIRQWWG